MPNVAEIKSYIRQNATTITDTGTNFRVMFPNMDIAQDVATYVTLAGWPCNWIGGNLPGLVFSFETL